MKVKVKYRETYDREHTVEVPAQEFLEWVNEDRDKIGETPAATVEQYREKVGNENFEFEVRAFLEAGDQNLWAPAFKVLDPFANVYEQEIDRTETTIA